MHITPVNLSAYFISCLTFGALIGIAWLAM
jgi:F0F1-type ATP synthase assembly protein I